MLTAIDLFAGAGGATLGLRDAGFDVIAAVENDSAAAATWRSNHPGTMFEQDIRTLEVGSLIHVEGWKDPLDLLKACPPCQGFSSLRGTAAPNPDRNDLVLDTLRFVDGLEPRSVLLENVPGLRRDERFAELIQQLIDREYQVRHYVVNANEFGVPQRRRRLVVVAVKRSEGGRALPDNLVDLVGPEPRGRILTAGDALTALYKELPAADPWQKWRQSSPMVQERIRAIPVNGTRFDLPEEHQLHCHRKLGRSRNAASSYGRVKADDVAPTMTTRCTTPACGAFIHPYKDRGLSLREAACFQTFPHDYAWVGGYDSVERQIGNAVPVQMARGLAVAVSSLLNNSSQ